MQQNALSQTSPTAMAFYHEDGFVPAWKQAARFAGNNGRIATLPDIIEARINTPLGSPAWEKYFTTMSAEYLGYSKGGNRILIVAHGIGPMSTLDGVVQAYSFEFKDQTRDHRGGRITIEQFADLESGKYGEVSIIDFESYYLSYQYAFIQKLKLSWSKVDPLVRARLGPRAEEYLYIHARFATEWHKSEGHGKVLNPYILQMNDESNCWYGGYKECGNPDTAIISPFLDKDGLPVAHLLSIGQISYSSGNTENRFPDFMSDVSCHAWHDGTRFLSVCNGDPVQAIHEGPDPRVLLRKNWQKLMVPTGQTEQLGGFFTLMQYDGKTFTMYEKAGERIDTHEPEFLVTKITPVGRQVPHKFETTVGGYHGFFKYGVKEVKAIAPRGANAYSLPGEIKVRWHKGNPTHHRTPVKFFRIEIDPTKRLMRAHDLLGNYELMMSLL